MQAHLRRKDPPICIQQSKLVHPENVKRPMLLVWVLQKERNMTAVWRQG